MLFGGTDDLTVAQKAAFRATGISHIVAASGYNVTLIVGWGTLLLNKFLQRRWAIGLGMLICIFYVLLAGATAAVVRAGVMSILVSTGLIFGRPTQAKWILIMTACCMLLWSPLYLEDIGFQLSIAATAGLVFFRPQGDWWTTIVAQVATLPIILHHFGNLSPIAPIVNILVLWMVPLVMQITSLSVIAGLLLNRLGQGIAYLAWPFLHLFNYLSVSFAKLTFSNVTVEPVSWVWVCGYYLVLAWVYFRWFRSHEA
jgi:competence protein ComEC